jgi:uncharacterized membrane protein YedE/YeeE
VERLAAGIRMTDAFRQQYAALFGRPWAVGTGAILVAATNVLLFAFDRPWTASDGVRNWGDWVFAALGVVRRPDLIAPWLYSGSLIDLGVIAGALAAALLAREFAIRVPPPGELAKGAIGGALMGAGAMLAFGCNIGGFVSATSALSLSGPVMMVGLMAGALAGLRYLLWETEHRPGWSSGPSRTYAGARPAGHRQPVAGAAVLLVLLAAPFAYGHWGYVPQGIVLLFGVAFGFVFQRSRFCLVRAFREPFMTGDAEHTRAAALAVGLSMLGFAILKYTDLKDRGEWVFASAGVGALAGGLLFGLGMTLAGGCGAGAIWRAGEGQVKLWVAVACFGLSASVARLALSQSGALGHLGWAVFLPAPLGWGAAVLAIVALMAAWAALATWNEHARRFSIL